MGDRFEDRARRLEGDDAVLGEALRNLPELQPRSDLWPEIRQVLERPRRRRRWLFAAAAVLAVAVLAGRVMLSTGSGDLHVPGPAADADVEQLKRASGQLEKILQAPGLRSQVLDSRRALAILELEDRIALVDEALARSARRPRNPERDVVLWAGRVELLDALVRVRSDAMPRTGVVYAANENSGGEP